MAADGPPPLLEISALGVAYDGAPGRAVDGVSVSVPRGGSLGLVGESGAGKTTVALSVPGLLPAAARLSGSVRFGGEEILNRPEAVRKVRWRRASIVLQDAMNAFNPVTTVGEQIAEVLVAHGEAGWTEAAERAGRLLDRVGLDPALARGYPHELSGGQRQRAAVAAAVALSPDLVIVDEPTSALDVFSGNAVIDLLASLRRGGGPAFLVVSHDVSVVARLCERVVVMLAGRVVEEGPVSRVLAYPRHPCTRRLLAAVPRLAAAGTFR